MPFCRARKAGFLDHRSFGERIAEGHAEFDDICTGFGESFDDIGGAIALRVPDCDERYDRRTTFIGGALECILDLVGHGNCSQAIYLTLRELSQVPMARLVALSTQSEVSFQMAVQP